MPSKSPVDYLHWSPLPLHPRKKPVTVKLISSEDAPVAKLGPESHGSGKAEIALGVVGGACPTFGYSLEDDVVPPEESVVCSILLDCTSFGGTSHIIDTSRYLEIAACSGETPTSCS